MSKIISIVNMKGGVGKTTTSIALADFIGTKLRAKVCLVDLDAQANSSFAMLGEDRFEALIKDKRTVDRFFLNKGEAFAVDDLADFITPQVTRLTEQPEISLIASSPRLRVAERQLIQKLARLRVFDRELEHRVARALQKGLTDLVDAGSFVVVDCPPGVSAFSEAALKISDLVIAPVNPDYLSYLGLDLLGRVIMPSLGKKRPPLAAVRTKIRANVSQPRLKDFEDSVFQSEAQFTLLKTLIPLSARLGRIVDEGDVVQGYANKYDGVEVTVDGFGREVLETLGVSNG